MNENPQIMPSPVMSARLRNKAQYGSVQHISDGISLVLADNAKDYTGPGTNCYIVGDERVWIIDPGPNCQTHINAVLEAVAGRPVDGIFVTHTHQDHSPAAGPLARLTGARTYGFGRLSDDVLSLTSEDVDPDFEPDIALACGATVGEGRWRIMALHTPGHFPNHMCYVLPQRQILFSGDHVMGWSTTVVAPPLGNLPEYMESLIKIGRQKPQIMLPSHGPVIDDPERRIAEIRSHRQMRHRQIAECVARGILDPAVIVDLIYEGLTPRLVAAAAGCVEAHLEQLEGAKSPGTQNFLGNPGVSL